MSGSQFMPFFIGDYLRDTQDLTTEEHGGYLLLLFACWSSGGALPDDEKRLQKIARFSAYKWKIFRPIFEKFFYKNSDGLWHQKRLDKEHQRVEKVKDARREAGSKGAAKRWHTLSDSNSKTIARARDSTTITKDSPSSLRSEEESGPSARAGKASAPSAENEILDKGGDLLGHRRRGLVRQMLTRHGPDPVRSALEAVERKEPADPAAYFVACCEHPASPASEPHDRLWYPGPSEPLTDEMRDQIIAKMREQ